MGFLEIGATIAGGLLNAVAGSEEDEQIEKRKQQALAMLRENIIDPTELDRMLGNVNRLFNNRLVNTLNSTALRSRGIANSNIVKGAVAGQMEGNRLEALTDVNSQATMNNKQIYGQMAGLEATMGGTHSFFGDFTSGALAAAPVAMELSKMLSPNNITTGAQPVANPVANNPFMGKTKIEAEDLTNFSPQSFTKMYGKKPWEIY